MFTLVTVVYTVAMVTRSRVLRTPCEAMRINNNASIYSTTIRQ